MSIGPQRLGKYELQERLERGGMGEVWKAYDTQLRRYVAIKLLHANLRANPDFISRFTREAQFVASLHHPNIIQVHDFQVSPPVGAELASAQLASAQLAPAELVQPSSSISPTAYMVMDYVEGGTLANYIRATSRKGLFPPAADIVSLFTAISLALDYAHQRGMIHRDIKPANILLDKRNRTDKPMGEPILTDFGIARLQGAAATTLTASILGTPRYISPEQAQGLPGDERSDLYSLGIILYEIVTGVTPFQGDNPLAVMMQHLYELPTPPIVVNPNMPPALSAVVLQSIAKDPADRFPTASAMTAALAQALNVPVPASLHRSPMHAEPDDNPLQPPNLFPAATLSPSHHVSSPQSPPPPTLPQSPPEKLRRRKLYIALTACILVILVGMSTTFLLASSSQKGATPTPNPSSTVVGHIIFISSKGTFDQMQIDLQNIPAPPAGKTYVVWLDKVADSEATSVLHWPLCTDHGTVHCLYPGNAQHSNLLDQNDRFLITAESVDSSPEIPDPIARLYYTELSHNGPTTFEVKMCPPASTSNALNPCR